MTAALACMTCRADLRSSAKFCDECGSSIAVSGTPAEYKQVTVLFADVVGSMDIAAAVGVERLREIMTELVNRASAVVQRYGGTVDKFTGDGIMAVFGAPAALEDHALRACVAGLGIQDEVRRLAVEVDRRDGVELRLRVGLNSGQVIAGEIGSAALGYTAIGEQVGMAQRMESVAPPGAVMLSASTARLVEGAVVLGEPELVRIKGTDHPVGARRLLGVLERHRGVGRAESNLVGRRWEMAAVEGLLERAIDGHGAVVGVAGSAGIGKSRLVREVAAMAAARAVEVFSAFCESHATDVPFRVVAGLLRAASVMYFGFAFYLVSFFSTASGRHMLASVWSWLQGRLPLRSTEFLDDAHTRGALRQIGAIYQFRHARLQDRLGSASTDLPVQVR